MRASHGDHPIVVTHLDRVQFAAEVRGHRILVDQPLEAGGDDSAPSPIEFLSVALGACVSYYVQQYCHARLLPHRGMRVEVLPQSRQGRIERFNVRIVLAEPLSSREFDLIERVARSCPAHATLAHGSEMVVGVEQPAPSAAPTPVAV